jgi:hypothetical protein
VKRAELDAYLAELETERGPITEEEAAEGRAWLTPPTPPRQHLTGIRARHDRCHPGQRRSNRPTAAARTPPNPQ